MSATVHVHHSTEREDAERQERLVKATESVAEALGAIVGQLIATREMLGDFLQSFDQRLETLVEKSNDDLDRIKLGSLG